jgi:hypothetical protein
MHVPRRLVPRFLQFLFNFSLKMCLVAFAAACCALSPFAVRQMTFEFRVFMPEASVLIFE